MSDYLNTLAGVGVYAHGAAVATYLVTRFGGDTMRDGWPAEPGDGLNGEAIFYIVAWPIFAVAFTAAAVVLVALSPVLIPAFVLGRLLWKRGARAKRAAQISSEPHTEKQAPVAFEQSKS